MNVKPLTPAIRRNNLSLRRKEQKSERDAGKIIC